MVILGVYVMARRRKGAGGNKAATKATGRTAKKVNGVPEERPNGSLITPMVVESEESCVSQEENHLPLSCKTPVEMCPGDPNLGEPPPMAPFSVHSVPHKKFGKFRCLLENAGTLQSQNCVNLEKGDLSVPETQMEEVVIEHMDGDVGEVIIEHEPVEIGEAQEVVWEEEVVEETVVCEGMEIELEESRSQDGAQLLEEADSQESDYDQMIEVKENDYSNQDDQVMVVRDGEFDGQEMVEVSSIPNMPDGHSVLVVKDARYENNSRHNTIIGIHNEVVTSKEDLDSEDSLGTVRGMEESSQESHMSVQAVKVEISDIPRIIQGKGSAYNTEHFSVNNEILTHPSVIMQAAGKDVSRVLCSQENINSLRECDENRRESDSRGKNLSPKHKKNSRVKNLEYYVDNFNSVRNIELKPSNCSFRVNNENMNKVKLMFSAECGQFPSQEINKKEDPFSSGDREDQEAEVKGDCGEGQDSNSPHPQCSHDFDEVGKNSHDDLDRKHTSNFRNRSGSTDTTGSESGSSCSTGVRRSSRIRSIGLLKQRNRKRNEVEPSAVVHESESTEGKASDSRDVVDSTQEETVKDGSNTVKMPVPVSCPATVSAPPVVPYEVDSSKPVKVKSRWRRSSELEMGGNRSSDSDMTTPPTPSISPRPVAPLVQNLSPRPVVSSMLPPARVSLLPVPIMPLTEILDPNSYTDISKEEQEKKDDDEKEKQERLNSFIPLMENEYLTDRSTSKEAKRMVCDCFLSKEEIMRGDSGCGEDCLNRLLMIECGSRCTVGEQCTNKRFQRQDYAKCEIFKTNKKGFGLRTLSDLPIGTFVMEYVGEVVDQKEFRRRAKDYAKDKNRHYYFMALKSDAIIDATMKGNISRFINHSCDPNAETQKWTVNGELRIGFFSKRLIQAGEEVTFDYQFQRYGKEAQRCFCETTNCRGWIGEDPEKEKRDRKERKERELKKKREERRKDVKEFLDDMDLEEEIEKLCASGLKNRTHTLTLCRLMVRAEERDSRIQLLKLIQEGEPACRRLFLDYHGLRLIWSWMMDVGIGKSDDEQELRIEILQTLAKLPIPNKTMLQDSKVMMMVEKWLGLNASADSTCQDDKKYSQSQDEESGSDQDACKPRTDDLIPSVDVADDDTQQGLESEKQLVDGAPELAPGDAMALGRRGSESDEEGEDSSVDRRQAFTELATRLMGEWNSLKEVFRIPKKERLEQMKEHEREADRGYKEYLDKEGNQDTKQSYDRHWRFRNEEKRERKRVKESPDSDRNRKGCRYEDRNLVPVPRMSKHERRQLFALKVAQEEEERRQQQELWRQHEDQCLALGMDPTVTAAFDPQTGFPCFFDPNSATWQSYPPQETNPLPPPEMVPSPLFNPNNPHHISGMPNQSVPPPGVPHLPPHGVPHNVPPPGVPPHGPPPHNAPPPHAAPPLGVTPHGPAPSHPGPHVPPPHTLPPHVPPHGPPPHGPPPHGPPPHGPPHRMPPPHSVPPPVPIPPAGYDPSNTPVPYDPGNPLPLPNMPPPQITQQPPPTAHPVAYSEARPAPHEQQGPLSDMLPLGSQPQPLYQQPPPTQQHIYAPQQPVEPQGVPQPQFHQVLPAAQLPYMQPVPALPPKWKSARDSEGRVYYYHIKTRVSQWEPPQWTQVDQQPESESSSDTSEEDEDEEEEEESSSTEEEEEGEQEDKAEDEDEEEEEEEAGEDKEDREDEEPKESEANKGESSALCAMEEVRSSVPEEGPSKPVQEEPRRKERRREGLVQERIISPRREEDRTDSKKYKEIKEKLRRKKELLRARERAERSKKRHRERQQRSSSRTVERPVTVAADTSSDAARKIKDQFRLQMASVIVQYLNPYRKADCKTGRIVNTEDFKHLARKLTHFVMLKELKHCRSVEDLECNDNVKHKARDFIKKYMAKFGSVYQRPKDDD